MSVQGQSLHGAVDIQNSSSADNRDTDGVVDGDLLLGEAMLCQPQKVETNVT